MIEETRTYWCDACGREIKGYSCGINVIEIDDEGYAESVAGRKGGFSRICRLYDNSWRTRDKGYAE